MEGTPYPIPPNECQRQEALSRYKILDTPPEESFDRLTRLAAQLFDVPVALISLLDGGRQWHKSCYGFDAREIDREVSFCAHNLVEEELMIVEDARLDPRFANNSLVTADPNIRFYAGAPLITPDDHSLGSLCVIDTAPRTFDATQKAQLRDLAAMAMDELELRREVAERQRAERQLRKSERQFRTLVERTNDWVWEIDREGRFTYVNPRATYITGYETEELIGRSTFDLMRDEEADRFAKVLSSYVEEEAPFDQLEKCLIHRDGHEVVLETSGTPIFNDEGRLVGYRGVARDATERKQARAALQASEERFRSLVSNLPGFVYRCTYDTDWTTLYMSHGVDELAGYPVQVFERGKRSFKEIVVPEDLPMIRETVRRAVEARSHFEIQYRVQAPDGSIRWIEDIARPCFDEEGRVKWLDGVMFDVTERKETEERLRLLETAVNDATESVLITDSELDRPGPHIVYANPGFQAMTGYRPEDVIGASPRILQGADTDAALLDELRTLLAGGDSFFGETVNYRKDGTPFVNEWSISPVHDDSGEVTHYVAVQRDITERKRMEEQLLQIRTAVENMSSAVGIADAEGRPQYLNAAGEELLGFTADELAAAGGPHALFADPVKADTVLDALTEGMAWQGEVQMVAKDGRTFPAMLRADTVIDDNGTIVGSVAAIDDLTERREMEARLDRYFDVTLDMLMFCSFDGVIQHVNRQFYTTLGYDSADAMRGRRFEAFLHPEDQSITAAEMGQLLEGRNVTDFINRYRHRDGSYRTLEWRAVPGDDGVIYAAARDVTEREKTKQELLHYAQRLEQTTIALENAKARTERILASITDAFFTLDHDWKFTYLNEQAEQLLERSAETLKGEGVWNVFADAVDTVFYEQYTRAVEEQESVQFEAFYPRHQRWYRVHAYPFEDGLSVFFSDVTDRKRAERALQESEEKYRTVVENVKDVVFRTDAEGRLTFLNPAWTDVTGHSIATTLGRPMDSFVHDTHDESDWAEFEAVLAGDKDFCRYEVQLKTSDDTPRWMEVFARPLFDEDGELVGTSGTLHDVTKWREAEAQMRKALDKERELGRLKSRFVSMASHELRTPLATIQSSAELADLFMKRGVNEKTSKHLSRIQNNVDRMATLLEDVLIFGRVESGRLPFEPVGMDAAGLATELVNDVRQGIGAAHTLQTSGLEGEIALDADPQLLRLILTNLLSNAVKYSAEGSTVRLDMQPSETEVLITVSDEGIGIPSEDLDRLFEPFHRAENVGSANGTGLGLSILKEAIDLHRGTVKVDSTEGEGSTFRVTLPRAVPTNGVAGERAASTMNDA